MCGSLKKFEGKIWNFGLVNQGRFYQLSRFYRFSKNFISFSIKKKAFLNQSGLSEDLSLLSLCQSHASGAPHGLVRAICVTFLNYGM